MTTALIRVTVAILLAFSVWSVSLLPASAEPPPHAQQTQRYFPWVPYGEVISDPRGFPDSGPYYGLITVQNLEDEPIYWWMEHTELFGELVKIAASNLEPHGSTTVQPSEFAGTSGVIVLARRHSDDAPARIAAIVRQVSPSMPDHPAETTGAHITVSGYTSLTYAGIAPATRVIPIAQTNSNWNTLVRITSFETSDPAWVQLTLREHGPGGVEQLTGFNIAPGKTHTLDMLDHVPEGWIGTVTISSIFHVGAVAERIKNETNMLIMNPSRSWAQGDTEQVAPLIFRNWNHWNTGITVVNMSFEANDITVRFLSPEGELVHTENLTIPDREMDFIYLPAGDGTPFVGSATIDGTQGFSAVVDEVKYFGDDPDTGHAMSYTTDYLLAEPGQALAFPLFRRGNPQTGGGDASGIQIFNTVGEADVQILVYDQDGNLVMPPESFTLSTHHGNTFYSMDLENLPVGFTGSAVVRNRATGGQWSSISAVTNLVNYDVQYDGSASFNGRRFDSPEPEPIPPIIITP